MATSINTTTFVTSHYNTASIHPTDDRAPGVLCDKHMHACICTGSILKSCYTHGNHKNHLHVKEDFCILGSRIRAQDSTCLLAAQY